MPPTLVLVLIVVLAAVVAFAITEPIWLGPKGTIKHYQWVKRKAKEYATYRSDYHGYIVTQVERDSRLKAYYEADTDLFEGM